MHAQRLQASIGFDRTALYSKHMNEHHDFTIAEVLCPRCDHLVFEFVAHLAISPEMVCGRCKHLFKASNDSVMGGLDEATGSD